MEPVITSDLLNAVMGGLYTPLKVIEAMRWEEDPIELGAGWYMDIVCRSTERKPVLTETGAYIYKINFK